MVIKYLGLASFFLLAGCAGLSGGARPLGGAPSMQVVESNELPAPTSGDLSTPSKPYLIGPYDKLVIGVFGIEELAEREIQADAGGNLSFPMAGAIEASGKSPAQVAALIEEGLRRNHVRDPQVTVNLKEAVSQVVAVDGQVTQPGLYPVTGKMTLMSAVASARGTTEFAKLEDVVIFRTVGGQKMAALYNLAAIRRGVYEDPAIYANDVVVVGDSPQRRLFKDLLQTVPLFTTPLIVLLNQT